MAKKELEINIERADGLMSLKIKLPEEIENLFKKLSNGEIQDSEKWFSDNKHTAGSKFYKICETYQEIQDRLNQRGIPTFNDFGSALVNDNRQANLAPLRAVSASGKNGIILFASKFNDSGIDLERYVRDLGVAVKVIWQEFISKKELKAVITYEV